MIKVQETGKRILLSHHSQNDSSRSLNINSCRLGLSLVTNHCVIGYQEKIMSFIDDTVLVGNLVIFCSSNTCVSIIHNAQYSLDYEEPLLFGEILRAID